MTTYILKSSFTVEEAALTKARNPKAQLCDKNGFNMISWKGKHVVAAETDKSDKLTPYMLQKAVEAGAKQGLSD